MVLGIILGSSVLDSTIFLNLEQTLVSTSFGSVKCMKGLVGKTPVVIIRRHQFDPERDYTPPHTINYRAMISAFHLEGCERIIAFYSVGSLKETIQLSSIIVPDDYAYLAAPPCFKDEYSAHFVPSLDMEFRKQVIDLLIRSEYSPITQGTYFQTIGPRFETKAEIRLYKDYFEVVGMTGAAEATLAQELGIRFCMVGIVDNMGHGLGEPLTMDTFKLLQKSNQILFESVINKVVSGLCT